MMFSKKGFVLPLATIVIVVVAIAAVFLIPKWLGGSNAFAGAVPSSPPPPSGGAPANAACFVEDVSGRFNDVDLFRRGTDPATRFEFLGGDLDRTIIADDGTVTIPINLQAHGLIGNLTDTYFSREVNFNV